MKRNTRIYISLVLMLFSTSLFATNALEGMWVEGNPFKLDTLIKQTRERYKDMERQLKDQCKTQKELLRAQTDVSIDSKAKEKEIKKVCDDRKRKLKNELKQKMRLLKRAYEKQPILKKWDSQIVSALIESSGRVISSLLISCVAVWFGVRWLKRERLKKNLEEAYADITFLLEVEKYYMSQAKTENKTEAKNMVRELIKDKGFNWSDNIK